jgi:hypothetical protein
MKISELLDKQEYNAKSRDISKLRDSILKIKSKLGGSSLANDQGLLTEKHILTRALEKDLNDLMLVALGFMSKTRYIELQSIVKKIRQEIA